MLKNCLLFFNNVVPIQVAKSEEFQDTCQCDLFARHGIGFKTPSYHEIQVKYLKKKVETKKQILDDHKAYWKKWQ